MIYLILAIVCSTAISVLMRLSENRRKSRAGMFIWNYIVCVIIAAFLTKEPDVHTLLSGLDAVIIIGVITGILFLVSFILMQINTSVNGVVSTGVFMKLGLIVSILIAMVAFKEIPKPLQGIGIVIAFIAIFIFNYEKNYMKQARNIVLLLLLLIIGGLTDSMINVYDKIGNSGLSGLFFVVLFFVALICSIIYFIYRRVRYPEEKMGKWDIIFGLIIGIPNYFASKLLLMSLATVSSVIAYPIYSIGTLFLICLAGVLFFKERLSKQKWVAMAMIVIAVAMMQ